MAKTSKNKTKMWRKLAVKGYGRQLRDAMKGYNHPAIASPMIISLLKNGNIPTSAFDEAMGKYKEKNLQKARSNDIIQDVEIIQPSGV